MNNENKKILQTQHDRNEIVQLKYFEYITSVIELYTRNNNSVHTMYISMKEKKSQSVDMLHLLAWTMFVYVTITLCRSVN